METLKTTTAKNSSITPVPLESAMTCCRWTVKGESATTSGQLQASQATSPSNLRRCHQLRQVGFNGKRHRIG